MSSTLTNETGLIPVRIENVSLEILFKVDGEDGRKKLEEAYTVLERMREKFGADTLIDELAVCLHGEVSSIRIIGSNASSKSSHSNAKPRESTRINTQSIGKPPQGLPPGINASSPNIHPTNASTTGVLPEPQNYILTSQRFPPGTKIGVYGPAYVDNLLRNENYSLTKEDYYAGIAYMEWVAKQPSVPSPNKMEDDDIPF